MRFSPNLEPTLLQFISYQTKDRETLENTLEQHNKAQGT